MYDGPLREPGFMEHEAVAGGLRKGTRSRPLRSLAVASTVAMALGAVDARMSVSAGEVRVTGQTVGSVSPAVGQWLRHVEEISRVANDAVVTGLRVLGRETVVALGIPPQGALTEEGSYQLVWDHGRHHLLAEVFPGGHYDWFYRDRETGRLAGAEGLPFDETTKLRRRLERNLRSREA